VTTASKPARFGSVAIGPLSDASQVAVRSLSAQAADADGVVPLSEVPLLHLGKDEPWLTHVIVHADDGSTVGYAHIDRSGDTASAELVVHPAARRLGIGSRLLKLAEADARLPGQAGAGNTPGKELRVWAHGDLPAAQAFASACGYAPARELLLLSKSIMPDAAAASLPILAPGYQARVFQPGDDDAAWVRLNAEVFADHPEQGRLTLADLQARQQETWFNPADFHLLTTQQGELVAFNWTKTTPNDPVSSEIYAIGVQPKHRRRGLSKYLLAKSFSEMAAAGRKRATLYVEGDNEAALASYYTAGFAPLTADVQYAKSPT